MRPLLLTSIVAVLAIGCEPPTPPNDPPDLVSTAPDGTKLWHVYDRHQHQDVYFSTTGAQWEKFIGGDGAGVPDIREKHHTPSAKRSPK